MSQHAEGDAGSKEPVFASAFGFLASALQQCLPHAHRSWLWNVSVPGMSLELDAALLRDWSPVCISLNCSTRHVARVVQSHQVTLARFVAKDVVLIGMIVVWMAFHRQSQAGKWGVQRRVPQERGE